MVIKKINEKIHTVKNYNPPTSERERKRKKAGKYFNLISPGITVIIYPLGTLAQIYIYTHIYAFFPSNAAREFH